MTIVSTSDAARSFPLVRALEAGRDATKVARLTHSNKKILRIWDSSLHAARQISTRACVQVLPPARSQGSSFSKGFWTGRCQCIDTCLQDFVTLAMAMTIRAPAMARSLKNTL